MTVLKKIKKAIANFLEKLARENQQTFGKEGLDCCKLNRQNDNKK